MEIHVSFIEKIGEDETFILTSYLDVYPSYQAGQTLFLQITNHDDGEKSMRLTKFKITDVIHSLRENSDKRSRTYENPMGIKSYMGMEIYVKRIS